MKLNNDKFFKDFNYEYLTFINDIYINNSISYVKRCIKKEIDILKKINNLKQITIRNEDYWLIRGWSIEDTLLKIKIIKKNWKAPDIKSNILRIDYWLDLGYNEIEAKNEISIIQKNRSNKGIEKRNKNINYKSKLSPFKEDYWIKKGITDKNEIKFKINSQRKLNIEYWLNKGFNENESKMKVSEYQKENNNKRTAKWLNDKNSVKYKKQYNTNIEFYLNKNYTLEESVNILKDRQSTFTLEKCIIKNGLEEGTKIFNNRQKNWVKKMFNETTCMSTGRSLISDKFIEKLIISINNNSITENFSYGKNERFIYDNLEEKANRYDLCYNKKIIEFNGDFWHSNPKIYDAEDIHKIKKIKCSDVWKKDLRKIESAKEHDYEILVIWESEFINNEIEIINKCKKFLINEN